MTHRARTFSKTIYTCKKFKTETYSRQNTRTVTRKQLTILYACTPHLNVTYSKQLTPHCTVYPPNYVKLIQRCSNSLSCASCVILGNGPENCRIYKVGYGPRMFIPLCVKIGCSKYFDSCVKKGSTPVLPGVLILLIITTMPQLDQKVKTNKA